MGASHLFRTTFLVWRSAREPATPSTHFRPLWGHPTPGNQHQGTRSDDGFGSLRVSRTANRSFTNQHSIFLHCKMNSRLGLRSDDGLGDRPHQPNQAVRRVFGRTIAWGVERHRPTRPVLWYSGRSKDIGHSALFFGGSFKGFGQPVWCYRGSFKEFR